MLWQWQSWYPIIWWLSKIFFELIRLINVPGSNHIRIHWHTLLANQRIAAWALIILDILDTLLVISVALILSNDRIIYWLLLKAKFSIIDLILLIIDFMRVNAFDWIDIFTTLMLLWSQWFLPIVVHFIIWVRFFLHVMVPLLHEVGRWLVLTVVHWIDILLIFFCPCLLNELKVLGLLTLVRSLMLSIQFGVLNLRFWV